MAARVNIEACWWTDPRRSALSRLLGGDEIADGTAIRAWVVAQEFWKHGRQLIPEVLFHTLVGASHLLGVGLAELREGGVYVRGSSAYLDWVLEKRAAGKAGGKKSAQRPRNAKGQLQKTPKQLPSTAQADIQAEPKHVQASVSGSFSVSVSDSKNEESIGRENEVNLPAIPGSKDKKQLAKGKAQAFAAAYVKAYQTRWPGKRPEDLNDGKVRGQMLNWIEDYPLDRARELIQVFFQMETKWFGTKGYDFLTFRNNLNKIAQALDSGHDPDGNSLDWEKIRREVGA